MNLKASRTWAEEVFVYAIECGILERNVGNRGIVHPAERSGKWALCKSVYDQLQCC